MGTTLFIVVVGVSSLLVGLLWLRKWIAGQRKPARPPIEQSLRIGTFNTHLDSLIFHIGADPFNFIENPSAFIDEYEARVRSEADAIASAILLGGYDYDFIALIEVFSEEAREVLIDRLSGAYPHYIRKFPVVDLSIASALIGSMSGFLGKAAALFETLFGGLDLLKKEDSGLMLFSRFRIEETAFAPFTFGNPGAMIAAFPDSFAEKGAAYARIRDPRNGRAYDVVLTHLQENEEKWAWVRTAELRQIREFIERLGIDVATEELFVMGDFNLNGLWMNLELPPKPKTIEDLEPAPSSPEWKKHFGDPASFFASTLHDTWFRETSRRDAGPTSVAGGERIDYILHNGASTPNRRDLGVQHLTRAYNLSRPDGRSISDHMGVNADLNVKSPHCNPREALLPLSFDKTPWIGEITFPGSMVWYRIDEPGTYSFAVIDEDSGVSFEVYESLNLSLPIRQYKKETTTIRDERNQPHDGRKFHLPDAPYYVRVFHEDRTRTSAYALLVHKHAGVDANDAITLSPYVRRSRSMPVGKPLNPEDTIWFQLNTEHADSGKAQSLLLRLSDFAKTITRLEVRAADATTVLAAVGPASPDEKVLALHREDVGPSRMYLLVRREDAAFAEASMVIEWQTNLTILHGRNGGAGGDPQELLLHCDNETDPESFGADQMMIRVWVDDLPPIERYVGEFEAHHPESLEGLFPEGFHYLEAVRVQLVEKDEEDDDESPVLTIPILKEHREDSKVDWVTEFDGGRYYFRYNLSHRIEKK